MVATQDLKFCGLKAVWVRVPPRAQLYVKINILCRGGEMADALALGASESNLMEVQVLSPAQ